MCVLPPIRCYLNCAEDDILYAINYRNRFEAMLSTYLALSFCVVTMM